MKKKNNKKTTTTKTRNAYFTEMYVANGIGFREQPISLFISLKLYHTRTYSDALCEAVWVLFVLFGFLFDPSNKKEPVALTET